MTQARGALALLGTALTQFRQSGVIASRADGGLLIRVPSTELWECD
jgi:hypothetical protein